MLMSDEHDKPDLMNLDIECLNLNCFFFTAV